MYKSPSKMTSPEKKAFSQQLFDHDDQINLKVSQTLKKANKVSCNILDTIEASKQVIKWHDEEQKNYKESVDQHSELTCNKYKGKYKGVTANFVEPNLVKRMKARKDRAAIKALK